MDRCSVRWRWGGRDFRGCVPQGLGENWQVGEGWRGAGLISSSEGVVGEASQREGDVVEREKEVVGPPQLEISNGLATLFLGRRETRESPGARFPPSPRCWDPSVGVCAPLPPTHRCVISPGLAEPLFHPSPSHRQGSVP